MKQLGRQNKFFAPRILVAFWSIVFAAASFGQATWVKDASEGKMPAGAVAGKINGKPVVFAVGRISKSGYITLGSPNAEFDHYTVWLKDADMPQDSKFSALITVTVRKGQLPDGKSFRANYAPPPDKRAGLTGEGYWIPELYTVQMTSRRGTEFMSGTDIVSSSASQEFTGRVEFDSRKNGKLTSRLFICYNDEQKSCFAGTIELSIE